jgi:hypothetical protein
MSIPANPLDEFVSYTYHFELHGAKTWEQLNEAISQSEDQTGGLSTTPYEGNGTLLINTRKDAAQTIDNVRFIYGVAGINIAHASGGFPMSLLSMEVFEPSGMFFAQKLQKQYERYDMVNHSLLFGLKIFFVGQKRDQKDVTMSLKYFIPMTLSSMDGTFTHVGGHYNLKFDYATALVPQSAYDNSLAFNAGYVNNAISISATNIRDALQELENKLNMNWESTYKSHKANLKSRPLKYKIVIDSKIPNGTLNITGINSTQEGDKKKLTFYLTDDISAMINKILTSSKEVNDMVAASGTSINKQFQPGVKYCTITPMFCPHDDNVEIIYSVKLYEGGVPDDNQRYEFDYYFAEPGKNVDVMQFEVKFPELLNRFVRVGSAGLDKLINITGTIPHDDPANWSNETVHEDVKKNNSQPSIEVVADESTGGTGDITWCPAKPLAERTAQASKDQRSVNSRRLAFNTAYLGTLLTQQEFTFSIRGNSEILEKCISYPILNSPATAFGTINGTWIKVNIFNIDENKNRVPFYYTGWYLLMQVENVFHGSTFVQFLKVYIVETNATTAVKGVGGAAGIIPATGTTDANDGPWGGEANRARDHQQFTVPNVRQGGSLSNPSDRIPFGNFGPGRNIHAPNAFAEKIKPRFDENGNPI